MGLSASGANRKLPWWPLRRCETQTSHPEWFQRVRTWTWQRFRTLLGSRSSVGMSPIRLSAAFCRECRWALQANSQFQDWALGLGIRDISAGL